MQRRSRRRKKKRKSGRLIGTFLLVGLLAIGCGWMINRLIVQGYLFRPAIVREDPDVSDLPTVDPPGEEEEQDEPAPVSEAQLKMRSFRFYLLQVGALNSASAAEGLVQQLETEGYPGAWVKEGGYYKVFAGIYSQKEAASAVGQMLKEQKHEDAWAKEVALAGVDAKVTGASATYVAAAKESLAAIDAAFADLLAASSVDAAKASALKQQVDRAHERLSALTPNEAMIPYHSALMDACADLLATVNQLSNYLDSNDQADLLQTNSSLMDFALNYQSVQSIIRNILQ